MLHRIVWQVFADNRPSKIAKQSTECIIWFDPQNNISTLEDRLWIYIQLSLCPK